VKLKHVQARRRSELLLVVKCNETIRADKEKVRQLIDDREATEKQLQLKTKEFEALQVLDPCT